MDIELFEAEIRRKELILIYAVIALFGRLGWERQNGWLSFNRILLGEQP